MPKSSFFFGIRWASAVLIVAFPVYILMSWMISKDIKINAHKMQSAIRRWLLYLTLFLAAITIIVDLITLVFNFYNGQLQVQFYLKTLVVLLAAVVIFWYYLWELKRSTVVSHLPRNTAIAVGVVMLASIIAGFFVVGSPFYQRQVGFDERRVTDLMTIQNQVISYWQKKSALPASIAEMDMFFSITLPVDPDTKSAYVYSKTGNLTYELCAVFSTDAENGRAGSLVPGGDWQAMPGSDLQAGQWDHGKGRVCFPRTINPDLYKIPPAPLKI